MNEIMRQLKDFAGTYCGEGINHEDQSFTGKLSLEPLFGGRGFSLRFSATGKDGTLYHQEHSTLAPSLHEKLTLWNFNTNTPGLIPHELRRSQPKAGAFCSLIFGFNEPSDTRAFREEVTIDLWETGELSYTYSWGLPGGEFKDRSGVRMSRSAPEHH